MGDGLKRSPLHQKGPRMGYSTMDGFRRSPSLPKEEISVPSDPEAELTTIDRLRRYDAVNIDTCRAPVYVPCNIPRWCPVPHTFFDHRQNHSHNSYNDRYGGDQSARRWVEGLEATTSGNQQAMFHGPNFIPTSPNIVKANPCHYVDLDISTCTSMEPLVRGRNQHFQPVGGAPLSREAPCEYAQLDFDASGNNAQSQVPICSTDYSASQWQSDNFTVDSEFVAKQPAKYVGYESVGCQADLDESLEQNAYDFEPIEDANPPWTFASPYSEIPVYRRAYDQFRSASSSPYRVAPESTDLPYRVVPESTDLELLRPCQVKEDQSPRRQKIKKHRVSFKVSKILHLKMF